MAAFALAVPAAPAAEEEGPLSAEAVEAALAPLSWRARQTYKHLCAGKWYPTFAENTPAAMEELIAAGLVGRIGRVKEFVSCYVPKGTVAAVQEIIPPYPLKD